MAESILKTPVSRFLHFLQAPITCEAKTNVAQVLKILKEKKVGSIIITEDNLPMGIFTERDYLMKIAGNPKVDINTATIDEFMTENPKSVLDTDELLNAAKLMRMGKFRHVVIVNKDTELLNICSVKDLLDFVLDEIV